MRMSKAKICRFSGSSGSLFASNWARDAGSLGGVAQALTAKSGTRATRIFFMGFARSTVAAKCFRFIVARSPRFAGGYRLRPRARMQQQF